MTTGWIFDISLCENSINQSINQKILSEKAISEKAFSDHIRSGFLVPYQKSRFLISFPNSIRSGLIRVFFFIKEKYERI